MGALSDKRVGEYVSKYFVASFQKVATFRIVGTAKQGGNVAAYLCAPDGRVLNCVAGPVDAATMLDELKWTVETAKKAIKEAGTDGGKFKAIFRTAHAAKLKAQTGIVVEPTTYDAPEPDPKSPLTYRDPSGRSLAPKLPPPPIDGPDVTLKEAELAAKQDAARGRAMPMAGGMKMADIADRKGRRWALGTQDRVHMLLAGHSMAKIERVYGSVFENILGEKISTRPVEVVTPFPWAGRGAKPGALKKAGG